MAPVASVAPVAPVANRLPGRLRGRRLDGEADGGVANGVTGTDGMAGSLSAAPTVAAGSNPGGAGHRSHRARHAGLRG